MKEASRRKQAGITAIGFLCLATVFGLIGLAGLKIVPLYLDKMRFTRILNDLEREYEGGGASVASLRVALDKRFEIEGIELPRENLDIEQGRTGLNVRIHKESRAPFIADLWFVVVFDKQVEISR